MHTQQESCHVMPSIAAHAVNTNDIMHASHNMHVPASQPSLSN